jgi:subtilisin-like proprotein convertase family protein
MMMKASMFAVASAAALIMASAASAASATGAGGPIPDFDGSGVWPQPFPATTYSSSVNLGTAVQSIQSVVLTDLSHTWVGDLQVVLFRPDGTGVNILVRAGFTGVGFGSSADLGGTYTFVESGGAAFPTGGTFVAGGTYNQSFGVWSSGTGGVTNAGLGSVSGGSGLWTLKIYDWAGQDIGSIGSWTMNYTEVPVPGVLALIGMAGLAARRRRA